MSDATASRRGQGLGRAAASGVAWNAVGLAADRLIGFAAFAIVVRLLKVEEAGLVMLAASAVDLFLALAFSGFGERVIQHRSPDRSLLGTVFWLQVGAALLLTVGFFGASPLIALAFGDDRLTPLLQGLSVLFIPYAIAIVPSAILARSLRYRAITLAAMAAATLSGIAGVAVALAGYAIWALVVQRLVASVVYAGLALSCARWVPPLAFSRTQAIDTLRFSGPLLGSALVNAISAQTAPLMIGFFLPIDAVAYYRIAARLNEVMFQFLLGPINRVFLAIFSILREDKARARRAIVNLLRVLAVGIYLSYGLMAAQAPAVMVLLFGERWHVAGPIFMLLAIGAIGLPARAFVTTSLTSAGRTGLVFAYSGAIAAGIALVTLVSAQVDVATVAAAQSAFNVAMIPLSVLALRVALGVAPRDVLRAMAVPLAAGLGAAAIARYLPLLLPVLPVPLPMLIAWAAGAVAFALLHVALSPRQTRATIRELLALTGRGRA